jgi:hypothetical protein
MAAVMRRRNEAAAAERQDGEDTTGEAKSGND